MRRVLAGCAGIAALCLLAVAGSAPPADAGLATPAGTPCAFAATPEATAIACEPAGVGTPVGGAGLIVTLLAADNEAGPVDLTVEVTNARGEPVDDATVEIRTRHLGMDHGVSTDPAIAIGDGIYLAEKVSLGMGGTWQAEVHVKRESRPDVVVTFVVNLSGPAH